jgi:hypothetical protein
MRDPVKPSRLDPVNVLIDALVQVESGGDAAAVGDGGRSRGPLQISRAYWSDARDQLRREGHPFGVSYEQGVHDLKACEVIVRAYWRRYCRQEYFEALAWFPGDDNRCFMVMARMHNGGPRGARERATLIYWEKVRRAMAAEKHPHPERRRVPAGVR